MLKNLNIAATHQHRAHALHRHNGVVAGRELAVLQSGTVVAVCKPALVSRRTSTSNQFPLETKQALKRLKQRDVTKPNATAQNILQNPAYPTPVLPCRRAQQKRMVLQLSAIPPGAHYSTLFSGWDEARVCATRSCRDAFSSQ